jgi:IclR family acetate operon transcriptional repressor
LPKPTVRRLMKTLEELDWVAYSPSTRTHRLGARILQTLFATRSASELARIGHPFLQRLADETTESALLYVWGHEGPLTLDMVVTARHFKPVTSVGITLPGLATGDAQVLIAFSPEASWDAFFAPLQRRTAGLVEADREEMRAKWMRVGRDGVAYDREQWKHGVSAVAAPVFDHAGHVCASVSVVAPVERANEADMRRYTKAVTAAAVELSQSLAHERG